MSFKIGDRVLWMDRREGTVERLGFRDGIMQIYVDKPMAALGNSILVFKHKCSLIDSKPLNKLTHIGLED